MNNLDIYNKVRVVPTEAKKPIAAGRLKGMTDINPMWRIKTLTEQFGPVGFGWYYEITKQEIIEASDNQKVAFVNINLFVKYKDEWSKPIEGTGGSSFVAKEKNGMYTSDECFKMALTDALSVACKVLGIGADVYFAKDRSKYDNASESSNNSADASAGNNNSNESELPEPSTVEKITVKQLIDIAAKKGYDEKYLCAKYGVKEVKWINAGIKLEAYTTLYSLKDKVVK